MPLKAENLILSMKQNAVLGAILIHLDRYGRTQKPEPDNIIIHRYPENGNEFQPFVQSFKFFVSSDKQVRNRD
jgi:hypothetical protein